MRTTGRSDLVDIEVTIHAETDRAILVSEVGGDEKIWLPKSQIEINDRSGDLAEISLPGWLANEKDLV